MSSSARTTHARLPLTKTRWVTGNEGNSASDTPVSPTLKVNMRKSSLTYSGWLSSSVGYVVSPMPSWATACVSHTIRVAMSARRRTRCYTRSQISAPRSATETICGILMLRINICTSKGLRPAIPCTLKGFAVPWDEPGIAHRTSGFLASCCADSSSNLPSVTVLAAQTSHCSWQASAAVLVMHSRSWGLA